MATHYEVLGVPITATGDDVRAAYRVKARPLSLDRLQEAAPWDLARAARSLSALDEALRVLGDPARRAEYDAAIGVGVGDEPG